MSTNTNPVLGAVIIARHGDRLGFYQSPSTYTATATVITPLGEQEEYELGSFLQKTYLNPSSPNAIVNINPTVLVAAQVTSNVDGGGEGGVIFDSAIALWQGLYPPTTLGSSALANGTTVTSPLGGYQYVQINAILPALEVNLESYTNCNNWVTSLATFYASPFFLGKQTAATPFLNFLAASGLVGGRQVTLANMWNIFDFMNVQNIHNATYAGLVAASGSSTLAQVRALADWHEYYSFTSATPGGIGNGGPFLSHIPTFQVHPTESSPASFTVAGATFLPLIISDLQGFTGSVNSSTVRLNHFQIAYKPFLSLFNMTNVAAAPGFENPQSIVDYASVATFELRQSVGSTGSGFDVRFGFRNGTSSNGESGPLTYYPLFGSSSVDMDLTTFTNNLEPYLLNNLTSWCNACSNNATAGCQYIAATAQVTTQLAAANATIAGYGGSSGSKVSSVGAGFIGAGVTLFLGAVLVFALLATKRMSWGRQMNNGRRNDVVPLRNTGGGSSFTGSMRT